MATVADQTPIILYLENTIGQDLSLPLDPQDDFQTILDKAKSLLGYEMDLNFITKNRDVRMTDNVYDFLIKEQEDLATAEKSDGSFEPLLTVNTKNNNEVVYFLNDGTQVKMNTAANISAETGEENLKVFNIPKSPTARVGDEFFVNVPYKNLNNDVNVFNDMNSEEPVMLFNIQNSPKQVMVNNVDGFANSLPFDKVENFGYCRDTLGVDVCVTDNAMSVDSNKKEVTKVRGRKSNPSKFVDSSDISTLEKLLDRLQKNSETNCFLCKEVITAEKVFVFNAREKHLYVSRKTERVKVLCTGCLEANYTYTRDDTDDNLAKNEFLVVRNKVCSIYVMKDVIIDITTPPASPKMELTAEHDVKVEMKIDDEDGYVDVENMAIDVQSLKSDEVVMFNVGHNSGAASDVTKSSDIDLIESSADDGDVFHGDVANVDGDKYKCRFCNVFLDNIPDAIKHSILHGSEDILPCILCDYGYDKLAYLRGHMKRKHKHQLKPKPEFADTKDSRPSDYEKSEATDDGRAVADADNDVIILLKADSDENSNAEANDPEANDAESEGDVCGPPDKAKKMKLPKKNFCENCGKNYATNQSLYKHKCSKFHPHKKRGRKPKTKMYQCEDEVVDDNETVSENPETDSLTKSLEEFIKPRGRRVRRETNPDHQLLICDDCQSSFTSKVRLNFHMLYHLAGMDPTKMSTFKCDKCPDVRLSSESELFDHVHFGHRGPKKYCCTFRGCGKSFYVKAMLTKHARRHTDTRRYKCMTCDKRFLDKQTLDEHSITHLKSKPYECGVCGRRLTRASRLRMHMRAHRSPRLRLFLACLVCYEGFSRGEAAKEHCQNNPQCVDLAKIKKENLLRDTSSDEEMEESKESQKLTAEQEVIASEMLKELEETVRNTTKVVLRDKVFRCEFCDLVFCDEDALRDHRKCHDGQDNPFTCQICKASFSTYSRCTTHKTTHGFYKNTIRVEDRDDEVAGLKIVGVDDFPVVKHFLCPECPRSYLHWTYLQVHRRMKHIPSERDLLCDQCDATFHYSWRLKYHRKKFHSGTAATQTRKALIDHKIECRDCGSFFRNKSALYKHKRKEHWNAESGNNGQEDAGVEDEALSDSKRGRSRNQRKSTNGQLRDQVCADCDKTFRTRWELRAHARQKHPHHICVVEVKGLNPSPQQVLEEITLNQVPLDRVVDVAIVSVGKGFVIPIPKSYPELNRLMKEQKQKPDLVQWSKDFMEFLSAQQERLIAENDAKDDVYGNTVNVSSQQDAPITAKELAELLVNAQLLPTTSTAEYPIPQETTQNYPQYDQYYTQPYQTENYYYPQYGNLQDFYGNPSNYGNLMETPYYQQTYDGNGYDYYYSGGDYSKSGYRCDNYSSRGNVSKGKSINRGDRAKDATNYGFEEGWFGELSKAATDDAVDHGVMIDDDRFV